MRNSFVGMVPVGFACCGETRRVTLASMKTGRAPSREELRKARIQDRIEFEHKITSVRINKLEKEMNRVNKN